jgi:hypothetical protein
LTETIDSAAATAAPEQATTTEAQATSPEAAKPSEKPVARPSSGKQAAAPQAETPTLEQLLEKADPEELRRHPRVAGIVGRMLAQERTTWDQQQRTEQERTARENAERELEEMAKSRPLEFADRYLTDKGKQRVQEQLATMKATTARSIVEQVGRTFGTEFNLTGDELAEVTKALAGKTDDEVVPTFTKTVTRLAAEREAKKLFDQWREKELPKEREALRQEEAAKLLRKDRGPDMSRSRGGAQIRPHLLSDEDFDKWYDENVTNRRRY